MPNYRFIDVKKELMEYMKEEEKKHDREISVERMIQEFIIKKGSENPSFFYIMPSVQTMRRWLSDKTKK